MADAQEPQKSESLPPDNEQLELKLPDESNAPRDIALWAGVLALLTLIPFWPATTGSFIWRDDVTADNKAVLIAPGALSQSWFGRWESSATFNRPIYQPVTDTAYWLEYRAGGHNERGIPTSTSFHIAGLIFEAGAAILFWLILREMLIPGAWLIAAIFAVHPIHTEPVSWISEQGIVLSGMLFLGSVYCYLMFVKSREQDAADRSAGGAGVDPAQTWGLYSGAVVLCLMAILSQPSSLVIPVVIALLLWWKKRYVPRDGLLLLPLLLIGILLWFSNVDLQKAPVDTLLRAPLMDRAEAIGHGFWNLLFHLVLPLRFSVLYVRAESNVLFALMAGFAFAVLAILFVLKTHLGSGPLVAATIVVMLVCLSLNWFDPARLSYVTDGASYLAIAPLLVVIVLMLGRVKLPGPSPQTLVGLCTFVLIVLGGLALHRTYAFESSIALWRDVLKKDPAFSFAESSLAEQLRLQAVDDVQNGDKDAMTRDLNEAVAHAETATKLNPSNSQAEQTWANVLTSEGEIAKALPHFESAAQLSPNDPKVREQYGTALITLGRFNDARAPLNQALALDFTSAQSHRLLGEAYEGLNDLPRAITEQGMALQSDPSDNVARQNLAELLAKTGKYNQAIATYKAMMEVDQEQIKRPELWSALAKIKDQQGQYDFSMQYLQQAVQYGPDNAEYKKALEIETAKAEHAATTRAATRPSTTRSSR